MKKIVLIGFLLLIITILFFIIVKPLLEKSEPVIVEIPKEESNVEIIPKVTYNTDFTPDNLSNLQKEIIAHAGGSLYVDDARYTYTNCYKAIKNSYEKGTRLCEIDFLKTVDGVQVAFHSWDGFLTKFFGVESKEDYTHDEFMSFNMIGDAGQLDLETVIDIMNKDFPELILVTDTKDDNITLLSEIKEKYEEMMPRIIPQIYNQEEYHKAKDLGYQNIIYTLYESPDTDEEVVEFCKTNKVFAITMPNARATEEFVGNLKKIGVYVYTHTVDTLEDFEYLKKFGVDGVYTNDLIDQSKL